MRLYDAPAPASYTVISGEGGGGGGGQLLPEQLGARTRSVSFHGESGGRRWFALPSWAHVAQALALSALLAALVSVALGSRGGRLRSSGTERREGMPFGGIRPTRNSTLGGGQGPSLWCFALMMPLGIERELLAAQLGRGMGIFGCDGYSVFSNDSFPLVAASGEPNSGRRVVTLPIGGSLTVGKGGKWWTAMNTDIFVRVWTAVFLLGRFRQHDWTVKADPDTVFVPSRLKLLMSYEPAGPVYINNCRFGLHGPIEVLSRGAVAAYADNPSACDGIQQAAMDLRPPFDDEDHAFGEDEFLKLCLELALHVRRVDEFDLLLSEKACGHWTDYVSCDQGKVAFHPFKDIASFSECWDNASTSGRAWTAAIATAPSPALGPGWRPCRAMLRRCRRQRRQRRRLGRRRRGRCCRCWGDRRTQGELRAKVRKLSKVVTVF